MLLATAGVGRADERVAIAFVPLDDRPVTLQLPMALGAIAGQSLVVPPHAAIGHYTTPGDPIAIARWLHSDAVRGTRALVASSDMLAYGGLVASRLPETATGDAYVRLSEVAALKRTGVFPYIGIFGTIMRLAPTGLPAISATRAAYVTGDAVDQIAAYANLPDPPITPDDRRKAGHLRELLGSRLTTYLATRIRDRDVDEWALGLASVGDFDRIVIGQDDAGPVGLHRRDVAQLSRDVRRFDIGDRAAIEPGADELGMVMLARVFAQTAKWTPTIRVIYSRVDGGTLEDHLEYVPIDTTIGDIVDACGARRVESDRADIDLFVRVAPTEAADEAKFEDAIVEAATTGRSVAVADLSFLVGTPGDDQRRLTQALIARGVAGKIDAFASWNTNANTIGTAVPTAIAVGAGKRTHRYDRRAHAQLLLDRYIDDYAFHQFVRPELNATLRARGIDTTYLVAPISAEAASVNRAALWPYALDLSHAIFPQYGNGGLVITLPWERTFETQIDVRLRPAADSTTR